MAFWKRRSRQFEPLSPQTRYTVTYLGHEEMTGKVGLDYTMKPVDDMYRQFKKVKAPCRMQIEVVNNGIRVEPLDAGVRTLFANSPYFVAEGAFGNVFFPINKLSFGAADPYHTKVFCFVSLNENLSRGSHWDCHAVVCDSSAMAKNLTLYLVKAFQRIADSTNPIAAAQRSKKTTTVHILRERGTLEHQLSSKKKGKRPPVSTLKITLNVEGKSTYDKMSNNELDNNRKVADILAKHRSMDISDLDDRMVQENEENSKDNGNMSVSMNIGTSSSDKENDAMDDIPDEMGDDEESPGAIVVTVAINPDLSSPSESPRKSPPPGRAASSEEEEDDVPFSVDTRDDADGHTSPQEMITTMSPPDTHGYLSNAPSSTLPNIPKPRSPSSPKSQNSPKGDDATSDVVLTSKVNSSSLPKTQTASVSSSSTDQASIPDDSLRRKAPTTSASPNTDYKKESDTMTNVSKRESPCASVPPPSSSPLPSSISPTPDSTTDIAKASGKKLKKDKRKSVRFADDHELID